MVYRAVDETLGRQVAIKILTSEAAASDLMKRFRTEAAVLARLNHPGIASIYELFSSGPDLLMVMEFVSGQTLERLSSREGPMTPARAVHLVDGILSALEHAHRAGIVHRDIKPANVMVGDAGSVKIMDFGIARVRGVEHITVDGCLMGTPAYISPEHVRGEAVDERADLYAVGVIFYRLLTGRLPFDADSTVVMLQKHVSERPTALREHRPDLPRWCDAIVQRAMAKAPAKRFQTASEFRSALRRAAAPAGSRAARTRQSTIVLSGDAAKVVRQSAVSATPARPSSSGPARWPLAVASIALVASLVLLAHVTARAPGSPHVVRPASVVKMRAPTPVHNEIAREAKPEALVVPAVRKTYPARAFVTKGLVENGRDQRMRDVRLVLSNSSLTVSDDATRHRLQMVPFDDVRAITYSHGRDPMWNSSRGPTPIVRTSGRFSRALGFGAKRHWISLMTRKDRRFVIFGVNDSQVADVLSALEERTGQTPQLVESRKGAD